MLSSSAAHAVWASVTMADTQNRPPLPDFKQYPLHVTTLCTVPVTGGAERWRVRVGRAYIDMFVNLRFECRGESSVQRSLANSTNNGVSKCLCVFRLVCGVFLLNLTKIGKYFTPTPQ